MRCTTANAMCAGRQYYVTEVCVLTESLCKYGLKDKIYRNADKHRANRQYIIQTSTKIELRRTVPITFARTNNSV